MWRFLFQGYPVQVNPELNVFSSIAYTYSFIRQFSRKNLFPVPNKSSLDILISNMLEIRFLTIRNVCNIACNLVHFFWEIVFLFSRINFLSSTIAHCLSRLNWGFYINHFEPTLWLTFWLNASLWLLLNISLSLYERLVIVFYFEFVSVSDQIRPSTRKWATLVPILHPKQQ